MAGNPTARAIFKRIYWVVGVEAFAEPQVATRWALATTRPQLPDHWIDLKNVLMRLKSARNQPDVKPEHK